MCDFWKIKKSFEVEFQETFALELILIDKTNLASINNMFDIKAKVNIANCSFGNCLYCLIERRCNLCKLLIH